MVPVDVTSQDSVDRLVDWLAANRIDVDVLINNAGIGIAGSIEDTSTEEAKQLFEANFFGPHRLVHALVPTMRARGHGTIINVGSIGGRITIPFQGFYSASKAAVTAWTEALRIEVAPFGVAVVLVEPGDFATGFTDAREMAAQATSQSPYASACTNAVERMADDERNGSDPAQLASLIVRVVESRRPKGQYRSGMLFQRFAVHLRKFLPAGIYDRAIRAYYRC